MDFDTSVAAHSVGDERRQEILDKPGFGQFFTDHMVTARWGQNTGWHDARLQAYAPISMDPASAVLHYGQAVFEGFKAYRHPDGSIVTFRPESNGRRFQRSAARLALPELPVEDFMRASDLLITKDRDWVPTDDNGALYIRPFMFGTEAFLGVRPSRSVQFILIASPVGSYFSAGERPLSIWLSENYTRAAAGGTGAAKCAGNYAAGMLPQQEATDNGCDQVAFLDAAEQLWIEELGGMNIFFVKRDGTLITPELTGTILDGVTRDSILTLAHERGHQVEERRTSIDEWRQEAVRGEITEVFACGTAAVVTPIGRLKWSTGELVMGDGEQCGPVTAEMRQALVEVQRGIVQDEHGWIHHVC